MLAANVCNSERSGLLKGCFIFEAQPWQSYRKKRTLTPQIRAMFKSIELKPAMFHEYLLETIGFKRQV